jgi:hypothetical protein
MSLEQGLDAERIQLRSDSYQMSIGELGNLYQNDELTINPEFQRALRWTHVQKVAFIESILMQFPLPTIFVAAGADGKWDLLDGLQRITTIFEFMGILKRDGVLLKPLPLLATERFPELEGLVFESTSPDEPSLTDRLRLDFKRERMDVKIILRESKPEMKYDLFLRLTTGGTPLTAQDARNAIMANVNSAFRTWIDETAKLPAYLHTLALSEKDIDQRYHEELLLVFLLIANDSNAELAEVGDLVGGLDAALSRAVQKPGSRLYNYDIDQCEEIFAAVFESLNAARGVSAFERSGADVPKSEASFGLRREAFVTIVAAMCEANRLGRIDATLQKLDKYWLDQPKIETFADAVLWGRRLAQE